ncbi:MAG: 2-C-methyl-D-erythritol 2,4-cyclodiphosphate synthase [Prevotellaceae bacterium]|jgi:2-C-methyl-D-erythritol 2,4-cyclodiphosphate synthase|nr:2-C-methyl-D-erythritol 2,4-cyclodiphosphate synthase [Prevotellaceae bacterium]
MRIGFGFDVHKLIANRDLFIGGVKIEYEFGLEGHSDADVLIHAICDSLLGAAGLRDIGYHFPDTDPQYKNIDSKVLLKKTVELLRQQGYSISNIDSTICAESPKLNPYIDEMREVLSKILNIPVKDINIKATTTETLGFVGRKEGIAAYAITLINE